MENIAQTSMLRPPFRITLSAIWRRLLHPLNPRHWYGYFWALDYSAWLQKTLYTPGQPTPESVTVLLRSNNMFIKAIGKFDSAIEYEAQHPIPDQPYAIPYGGGLDLNVCPHCGSQSMMGMSDWEFHHSELPTTTSECLHCHAVVYFQRKARTIVDVCAMVQPQGHEYSSPFNIACSHHEVGVLLRISNQLDEAMERQRTAAEMMENLQRKAVGRKPWFTRRLGIVMFRVAEIHHLKGDLGMARANYQLAKDLMKTGCPPSSPPVALNDLEIALKLLS
jgi:hypothetical protein